MYFAKNTLKFIFIEHFSQNVQIPLRNHAVQLSWRFVDRRTKFLEIGKNNFFESCRNCHRRSSFTSDCWHKRHTRVFSHLYVHCGNKFVQFIEGLKISWPFRSWKTVLSYPPAIDVCIRRRKKSVQRLEINCAFVRDELNRATKSRFLLFVASIYSGKNSHSSINFLSLVAA